MDARLLALQQARALRPLDAHFADLLLRHAARPSPELALAAALVSRHTGEGHVCLPLGRFAGRAPFDEQPWRAPPLAEWREALLGSGVVGEPGAGTPLILDSVGRLYLHRLWRDEAEVARDLLRRAAPRADVDPAALHAPLRRLFPDTDPGSVGQRRAAAVAALHGLGILCGGPGTGKTHTVARLLALLMELSGERPLRLALAAPTGKAAQRLAESLRKAADVLPAGFALPASIPTLHRLLGLRPDGSARHDADHPLRCDLLLIDEASMVDLPLLARTLRALPPAARLILLGDPNQLASVEAGAVLGELCAGAGAYSPAAAARIEAASGDAIPGGGPGGIGDAVAKLEHSYRFAGGGAIGRLAAAVNAGDAQGALELLRSGGAVRFETVDTPARLVARLATEVGPALQPLFETVDPATALARLGEFQVLTALREGAFGVSGVNAVIERALQRRGLIRAQAAHYPGRPLLIGSNDYALGLFNGDLGLLLPDPAGALRAWFTGPEGTPRALAPSRLPAHESAYALTVHKSQGSEFTRVLLILPPQPSPLLTRELIYTALTRAREGVTVWGSEATLAAAIGRRLERDSGLGDALRMG
ncbi:exodeoxyribonuclease V subunit alpha [Immundisolibacter sp.]|uniref:exodeoxyribonuclease V subunit alpha n=1 Tax=Immundisolibacter sp. TaxID=1934948 RepID=UPI002B1A6170|nr:exodeoxyribonuclease V subunit alpha [Immundisolibacter sp.]MEA3221503.1 RecBCD enzyme subunit RecD [Immundisolibacter sp.]